MFHFLYQISATSSPLSNYPCNSWAYWDSYHLALLPAKTNLIFYLFYNKLIDLYTSGTWEDIENYLAK